MFTIPDYARPFLVDAAISGAMVFGLISFWMVL